MFIPDNIRLILDMLNDAGFDAYVVGGCVRDALMGKQPHDFDITTSALPDEVKKVFSGFRVIETGLRHGTVTVLSSGDAVEITTFRVDGEYNDGRHPDSVEYSRCLEDDLMRRDFTVNAIAYNPVCGFVDVYGGENDINEQMLRCVGEPDKRFGEDALRIMRALRFSSVLGFDIHPETASSIHRNRHLLKKVSAERIFIELKQLLMGSNAVKVLLEFSDVICSIIPEFEACVGYEQHSKYHCYTLYEHIVRTVAAAEPVVELKLAMLFHDIGKPYTRSVGNDGEWHYYGHAKKSADMAEQILRRFKSDNKTCSMVYEIIKYHDMQLEDSRRFLRRRLSKHGSELFELIVKAHIADDMGKCDFCSERIPEYYRLLNVMQRISQEGGLSASDLAVKGSDISELIPPSPLMGEVLRHLFMCVVDETVPNERGALMGEAERYIAAHQCD